MFVKLGDVAYVNLGYKSLQNDFFYVNKATVDTYGIEKIYLVPILMLRDLDGAVFEQNPKPNLWLFACRDQPTDLRGTGASRYIDAMADRSAADKKQSGKKLTVKEVLKAQSGELWYAPKAKLHKHHIWLRKAFDATYSPFLFNRAVLVDQRLNSVSPLEGVDWKEIAAAVTTTLFSYSLEINGAAAMGAGALEAATTKLRDYPILNIAALNSGERKSLVALAEAVWSSEVPVDWASDASSPGPKLRAFDEWVLNVVGRKVSLTTVYDDICSTCRARIAVAEDKRRKTKKREADSIGHVADSIVKSVMPIIQSKNFPDDFVNGANLDLPLTFDRKNLRDISLNMLLDNCDIDVRTRTGESAYLASHSKPVAEAIVRAILWGRTQFSVSTDRKVMDMAVNKFLDWVSKTESDIEKAINESAYGTGYEDALMREVFTRLGIHPLSGAKVLPSQISL